MTGIWKKWWLKSSVKINTSKETVIVILIIYIVKTLAISYVIEKGKRIGYNMPI